MDVNVSKEKKLTNMRTTSSDENIKLETPRQITLELALEFIQDDELIEITPERHPAAQAHSGRHQAEEGPEGRRPVRLRPGA